MKKKSLLFITFALVLIFVAACGNNNSSPTTPAASKSEEPAAEPKQAENSKPIRVGLICGTMNPLLAVLGLNNGAFEENNVNIEKVCFSSGSDAVQAMVGGSIDINIGSYEHVLRQLSHDLDVKAYAEIYNGVGYSLIAKKDSPYQTVADLKGQKVGVTRVGSLSHTGLRLILEQEGIDSEKGVEVLSNGAGATMFAAIESDNIAAGMVPEPISTQMISSGKYHALADPQFNYAGIVIMAKTEWVDENKEAMKGFLKVLKEVRETAEQDVEGSVDALAKDFKEIPREILAETFKKEIKKVPTDLKVSKEGAQTVVQSQDDLGLVSEKFPFEETVDFSLLPKE